MEEFLKILGPFPILQLFGGLGVLYAGFVALQAGQKDKKSGPTSITIELPEWFVRDFISMKNDVQKTAWIIDEINNKIELLRGQSDKSVL